MNVEEMATLVSAFEMLRKILDGMDAPLTENHTPD